MKGHFTFLQLSFSRVTQVANLGGGRQVIRVKNCSGQKTVMWSGAWNPDDTRWANLPPGIQRELDAETFHDGGFWMAYGDFLKYFEVSIFYRFWECTFSLAPFGCQFPDVLKCR